MLSQTALKSIERLPFIVLCHDVAGRVVFANREARGLLTCARQPSITVFDYLVGLESLLERVTGDESASGTIVLRDSTGTVQEIQVFVSNLQERPQQLFCTAINPTFALEPVSHHAVTPASAFSCIAHEIVSLSSAGLLLMSALRPPRKAESARRYTQINHLLQRVEKLARCATWSSLIESPELVNVEAVIDEVLLITSPQFEKFGVHLQVDVSPDLWIRAARTGVLHILLNLISNAFRAILADRTANLSIEACKNKSVVSILVKNQGRPISHPETLFTRFQPGAEQTGLGLYISRTIARSFHGDLSYEYVQDSCAFKLDLPTGKEA